MLIHDYIAPVTEFIRVRNLTNATCALDILLTYLPAKSTNEYMTDRNHMNVRFAKNALANQVT